VILEQVEDVVVATLESTLDNAFHWSRAKMAQRTGMSKSTSGRIFGLKPHLKGGFKLSIVPLFTEKVYDVVGLYLTSPEPAVVLCMDEKSQVQVPSRSQPAFPTMPGTPEKRTQDNARHGTTSLGAPDARDGVAEKNVADGTVISSIHLPHRAVEFKKFLTEIDPEVPPDLDIHIVFNNYSTHEAPTITTWLPKHSRIHTRFIPTTPLGSSKWDSSSPRPPAISPNAATTSSSKPWRRNSGTWSQHGTTTLNLSSGPRPATGSSTLSHDYSSELAAQGYR